jgi:hypothetical protein
MTTPGKRPTLDERPDPDIFVRFYYLKEELLDFCRANGLLTSGSKANLIDRVGRYLRTGEAPDERARSERPRIGGADAEPALDATLGEDFKCTQERRAFFESVVGPRFHFSVKLQRYMRSNPNATYADAIAEWRRLDCAGTGAGAEADAQADAVDSIDPQFEYNRYIRAFFADNPGRRLTDAIACWRLRRELPGPRTYNRTDLSALDPKQKTPGQPRSLR